MFVIHVRRRVVHIPVRQSRTSTRCHGCATRTGQGRTPIPLSCQGHLFVMSEILSSQSVCADVPPVSIIVENPCHTGHLMEGKPPNLLCASSLRSRCLRGGNRRFTRKARHDVRVCARSSQAAHRPARQTALQRPCSHGRPPNRATATIVLLNHNPSHSYVVSLP